MIIVNGWKLLTIITKSSILDVTPVLDPPLKGVYEILFIPTQNAYLCTPVFSNVLYIPLFLNIPSCINTFISRIQLCFRQCHPRSDPYFTEYIQCIFKKTHKITGLIRKLQPVRPRSALLTTHKSFLRAHFD